MLFGRLSVVIDEGLQCFRTRSVIIMCCSVDEFFAIFDVKAHFKSSMIISYHKCWCHLTRLFTPTLSDPSLKWNFISSME